MNKNILPSSFFLTMVMALLLALSLPALADKPSSTGNKGNSSKNHKKYKQKGIGDNHSQGKNGDISNVNVSFTDQQRNIIGNYYRQEYHSGHCPPGLAKKNNGCMPPGQAKKWKKGSPLPRDVVYYDLPSTVVIQLGRPPEGHRYIRVASDILLIAVGTGMIVDAIEDLASI